MTTRAAINILGSTGEIIDITTLGVDTLTTAHPSPGVYLVYGSLGMAPPPEGWGYVLNQADADKTVDIQFADGILTITTALTGETLDLAHSITLHLSVEEAPPVPEPPIDPGVAAQEQLSRLRTLADSTIAPLQDAVDIGESTDEEVIALKAWKKFRIALTRAPAQAGYPQSIDWPMTPQN
jgi:hypothetical protein